MMLGPYTSFIVTSYVLVALVVVTLIVWVALDFSCQKRILHELEASGVKRRSGKSNGKPPGKSK